MSNWKVGPGGRLYHPTTGAYVGQLDDNGNEQMVVTGILSDGEIGKQTLDVTSALSVVSASPLPDLSRVSSETCYLHIHPCTLLSELCLSKLVVVVLNLH